MYNQFSTTDDWDFFRHTLYTSSQLKAVVIASHLQYIFYLLTSL